MRTMRTTRMTRPVSSLLLLVVTGAVAIGCQGYTEAQNAKKRVHAVLYGLQTEGGGSGLAYDLATPVCQWYQGTSLMADQDELRRATASFETWKAQQKIGQKIDTFEITGTKVEKGPSQIAVTVSVTIDGKPLQLRVIAGQPMSWVD